MKGIRSLLFVPAEERRLNKIGQTGADGYVIDLEDSMSDADKDAALQRTVRFLGVCKAKNIFVRVNRGRYETEMKALRRFDIGFMLPKIETIRGYIEKSNRDCELEVDGGIDPETAPLVKRAGANVLVAGSAVFNRPDRALAIREIRNA